MNAESPSSAAPAPESVLAGRLEMVAWRLLQANLLLLVPMAFAAVFWVTLGYDESWILAGILSIVRDLPTGLATEPVVTSGGLYALVQAAISALFGPLLWPQRLFTLACLAGLCRLAWVWGADLLGGSPSQRNRGGSLAVAGLLLCPGLLTLGTSAYAAVPALLMSIGSALLFVRVEQRVWRVLLTGVLAGLASASRLNCVVILPALLVLAWFSGRPRRTELTDAVAACAVAVAVLMGSLWLYLRVGHTETLDTSHVVGATGVAGAWVYPFLFNKWTVAMRMLPLPLLGIASAAALLAGIEKLSDGGHRLAPWFILLPFGWAGWGAWLIRSPIPHLRYLLPALACFTFLLGFALVLAYRWGQDRSQPWARLAALILALSCTTSATVGAARELVHGNGNVLSWEWSGQQHLTYFTRFRHRLHQQEAAQYLAQSGAKDVPVLAIGLNRELRYLAQRPVLEIPALVRQGQWNPAELPKHLVIGPQLGNFLFLGEEARAWMKANTQLEATFGQYAFYSLTGAYPEDPEFLLGTMRKYPGHPGAPLPDGYRY